MILHETNDIVIIATMTSKNVKTGNMVNIWILPKNINPKDAVKNGQDELVCFDCKHRPANGGACYVKVWQAPNQIYKSYKRGKYQHISTNPNWLNEFKGRSVRFGAYGEPVLLPLDIVKSICSVAANWTGYTHQWHKPEFQAYQEFFMASVDSAFEELAASDLGWRFFSVVSDKSQASNSIECLSDSHNVKCVHCGLCNGTKQGIRTKTKSIHILVHGAKKKRFERA